jgi:tetratricopeptide (TPR) repeat protein
MPFRFFQRFRIAPGLRLNVSKGGISLSAGPRGAQFTIGTSGTRATAGLPGTGLHYTVHNPHKKLMGQPSGRATGGRAGGQAAYEPPEPKLPNLSWLERLTTDSDSKDFIDGWQAWGRGEVDVALKKFRAVSANSKQGTDAAWVAAVLHGQREEYAQAISLLKRALKRADDLGQACRAHDFTPKVQVSVTPQVDAMMVPTASSARLFLAELQQSNGDLKAALATLAQALADQPEGQDIDPVMLAAFGELATEVGDSKALHQFNVLAAQLGNDTPIHTAVMLYRARALFEQKLFDAALSVLTPALRRKKDRYPELLRDIRFLRGKTYEALNKRAQARRDFERVYAEDPEYDGIRQALGL